MNSPWTIKAIVTLVTIGTIFSVIKALMLFQYFSYSPGPILIRTAGAAIGVAFAVFGIRGLLRGSNGWRIFYLVSAVLSCLGILFLLWTVMRNSYYEATTIWGLAALLVPQLFVLWALLLHGRTVRFFKPLPPDWVEPEVSFDAELHGRLLQRLMPGNSN